MIVSSIGTLLQVPDDVPEEQRPLRVAIAVGVGTGFAVGAICFFLVAIPFYTLASFEPNGLDRPIIRTGLFRIALPVGVVIALVAGVVAGWWYRQGRRWRVAAGDDRWSTR